jgi:hypothetical protein
VDFDVGDVRHGERGDEDGVNPMVERYTRLEVHEGGENVAQAASTAQMHES